jgi:hypothetical protein
VSDYTGYVPEQKMGATDQAGYEALRERIRLIRQDIKAARTASVPEMIFGIGGAPTRASTFPKEAAERKRHPVASGVLDYFPDAIVALARVSWEGNEQHNPGTPLHWDRAKSADEADALMRHLLERGTLDTDGIRHSAKVAWRAMAMLQKEIEAERG